MVNPEGMVSPETGDPHNPEGSPRHQVGSAGGMTMGHRSPKRRTNTMAAQHAAADPAMAVSTRRLHDSNHSGWWQLSDDPDCRMAGAAVFMLLPGDGETNTTTSGAL